MSATTEVKVQTLTYRRYREGDNEYKDLHQRIFQAGWSHKCPTYIQSAPPCQGSCPSGEDIRSYLQIVRGIEKPPLGADGKPAMSWQEYAWRRLTEANPFPAVMGRVCPAPCETGCNRNVVEEHVGINSVEHYLGDWAICNGLKYEAPATCTGKKVAVIGGGPAGLSCAYQLARKGHEVTLFDEHEHLGGMMRYGIPGFRTPRESLDAEIGRILDLGVKTRMNCHVGKDIGMEELRAGFDAVFFGLGAQSGRPLPVPGAQAPNCVTATAFLKAFNDGRLRHVGKRVVVIGGGDTASDCLRTALRLGSEEVTCLYRRTENEMPGGKKDRKMAREEGAKYRFLTQPVKFIAGEDGKLAAVECLEMRLGEPDAKGRRKPIPVEGSNFSIACDTAILALGYWPDPILGKTTPGLEVKDWGLIAVKDKKTGATSREGVFSGGDCVTGPDLVVTAMVAGRKAAWAIDEYLRNKK